MSEYQRASLSAAVRLSMIWVTAVVVSVTFGAWYFFNNWQGVEVGLELTALGLFIGCGVLSMVFSFMSVVYWARFIKGVR